MWNGKHIDGKDTVLPTLSVYAEMGMGGAGGGREWDGGRLVETSADVSFLCRLYSPASTYLLNLGRSAFFRFLVPGLLRGV